MGAATVAMPARDYENARVRIEPPFEMAPVVEGMPQVEGAWFTAMLDRPDSPGPDSPAVSRRPDGRRVFERLYPGRYRAGAYGKAPGHYLKSILLGPSDVTGRDFDLTAASPPLRYVIAPNAARATGTVENGAGVNVVLIDADDQVFVPGQDIRIAVCDDKGHFTLDGLRPGAWHAFAFDTSDNMNTDAIRDLVFRRGLARQAEVIRLNEGETATLKLRLSPWFE
jgi:hypothetical protein